MILKKFLLIVLAITILYGTYKFLFVGGAKTTIVFDLKSNKDSDEPPTLKPCDTKEIASRRDRAVQKRDPRICEGGISCMDDDITYLRSNQIEDCKLNYARKTGEEKYCSENFECLKDVAISFKKRVFDLKFCERYLDKESMYSQCVATVAVLENNEAVCHALFNKQWLNGEQNCIRYFASNTEKRFDNVRKEASFDALKNLYNLCNSYKATQNKQDCLFDLSQGLTENIRFGENTCYTKYGEYCANGDYHLPEWEICLYPSTGTTYFFPCGKDMYEKYINKLISYGRADEEKKYKLCASILWRISGPSTIGGILKDFAISDCGFTNVNEYANYPDFLL